MRRVGLVLMALLAVVALLAPAAVASHVDDLDFGANLRGKNEVPPVQTEATGRALFDVKQWPGNRARLAYEVLVFDIDEVIAAHIHLGCLGENGPIVATLFSGGPTGTVNGLLAHGTVTRDELEGPLAGQNIAALVNAMQTGCTYVNVHTLDHPSGEIRGQIREAGPLP